MWRLEQEGSAGWDKDHSKKAFAFMRMSWMDND